MIKLNVIDLVKVPIKKWRVLLKEEFNVIMLDRHLNNDDFSIGEEADNGFL